MKGGWMPASTDRQTMQQATSFKNIIWIWCQRDLFKKKKSQQITSTKEIPETYYCSGIQGVSPVSSTWGGLLALVTDCSHGTHNRDRFFNYANNQCPVSGENWCVIIVKNVFFPNYSTKCCVYGTSSHLNLRFVTKAGIVSINPTQPIERVQSKACLSSFSFQRPTLRHWNRICFISVWLMPNQRLSAD